MKSVFVQKLLLSIAGLAGLFIGLSLLFNPIAFEASAGIQIAQEPNILSEIRGMGGVILLAGAIAIAGLLAPRFRWTALFITSFYLLGYGLARLVSVFLDGVPSTVLVSAMSFEILLGVWGAVIIGRSFTSQPSPRPAML
ncbi:MAG: DUF4345 domain-containing protein [Bacteroidota bacterium]